MPRLAWEIRRWPRQWLLGSCCWAPLCGCENQTRTSESRRAYRHADRVGEGALAELQTFELAGVAPRIDVFEVGHRARGIADVETRRRTRLSPLIVVIAGRAVGRADHPAGARQQQLDPAVLGLSGHFDFLEAVVQRMPDQHRDGPGGLGQVVRHIGDEICSLRRLREESVRKTMDVNAVL